VSERKSAAENVYKKRRGSRRKRIFDLLNSYFTPNNTNSIK